MTQQHGGFAVSRALKSLGVEHLFTLTGGHIFPILAACQQDGFAIVDVRHEQTAAFGAEGWGRLTRELGVCAITAGPGVTNALSALAQARANNAPMLALGGRAPQFRWGSGSLQEIDHVSFVDPLAHAETVASVEEIAGAVTAAARRALSAPRGPEFLDFPLDVVFSMTEIELPDAEEARPTYDLSSAEQVASLLGGSERPVLVAGSNVWLDRAEDTLRALAEKARLPVFMNGQGRGCLPADHELAFARSRSIALQNADLVIVAGTPLDFRLGFGDFGGAKVVHIDAGDLATHVELAAGLQAPTDVALQAIADAMTAAPKTAGWLDELRAGESDKSDAAQAELRSAQVPIHPMRVYGELVPLLARDAIVIGDGGDFVSYAGREVPSYAGGCWLDPGPYGCLGCGPGYALAARLAYPDRQVVLLYGDGAVGFSAMEWESFVRLKMPVTCIVGNNGIWGLEKHPMRGLYGFDVAADLRPAIRYDKVMEDLGGRGELVTDPDELAPAFKRALEAGEPYLVNVITDPEIAYPRSANLA